VRIFLTGYFQYVGPCTSNPGRVNIFNSSTGKNSLVEPFLKTDGIGENAAFVCSFDNPMFICADASFTHQWNILAQSNSNCAKIQFHSITINQEEKSLFVAGTALEDNTFKNSFPVSCPFPCISYCFPSGNSEFIVARINFFQSCRPFKENPYWKWINASKTCPIELKNESGCFCDCETAICICDNCKDDDDDGYEFEDENINEDDYEFECENIEHKAKGIEHEEEYEFEDKNIKEEDYEFEESIDEDDYEFED